jgi:phosphoribosylaminoimidazole (AIR) synthetase
MMQRLGNVSDHEMFRTFNMGIGMVVICSDAKALPDLPAIGRVTAGDNLVSIR